MSDHRHEIGAAVLVHDPGYPFALRETTVASSTTLADGNIAYHLRQDGARPLRTVGESVIHAVGDDNVAACQYCRLGNVERG